MINVLIAEDNLYYATNLMNSINKRNEDIKVCGIAKNGKEALELLNSSNHIDVILLDLKMPLCSGKEVLQKIMNKDKYEDSCIVISGELSLIKELNNNSMINCVIRKNTSIEEIILKLNEILKQKEKMKKQRMLRREIMDELIYLGYDISYKGTRYLIETIEYIAENQNKDIDNLEKYVYPIISKKYNDSVHNIKCNINRANNNMYYDCKIERIKEYFHFDSDVKPKIKTVINTILNKIL